MVVFIPQSFVYIFKRESLVTKYAEWRNGIPTSKAAESGFKLHDALDFMWKLHYHPSNSTSVNKVHYYNHTLHCVMCYLHFHDVYK